MSMNTKEFQKAITAVSSGCAKGKHAKIEQTQIKVESDDTGYLLTATDLERYVTAHVADTCPAPIAACLPSEIIKLAAKFKGDTVELVDSGEGKTHIECGKVSVELTGVDVSEFPRIPTPDSMQNHTDIEAATLVDVLRYASTNDARSALHGIYLDGDSGNAVTTDGHRLGLRSISEFEGTAFIPYAVAKSLGKALPKNKMLTLRKGTRIEPTGDTDNPEKSTTYYQLVHEGVAVLWKNVEVLFPAYQQVMPRETEKGFDMVVSDMIEALDNVLAMGNARCSSVKLRNNGVITMALDNLESGSICVELDAVQAEPWDFTLGVNGQYLMDSLKAMDKKETVSIRGMDAITAMKVGHESGNCDVIMPLRV